MGKKGRRHTWLACVVLFEIIYFLCRHQLWVGWGARDTLCMFKCGWSGSAGFVLISTSAWVLKMSNPILAHYQAPHATPFADASGSGVPSPSVRAMGNPTDLAIHTHRRQQRLLLEPRRLQLGLQVVGGASGEDG
jgi:hypothetical protein